MLWSAQSDGVHEHKVSESASAVVFFSLFFIHSSRFADVDGPSPVFMNYTV